ncbi:MAG TPA: DUF4331 family protein [Acidobacteriota bacterium]
MSERMKVMGIVAVALGLAASTQPAQASSHREALAILNEPCADTTDIYAWVSPGSHDRLYLIANFLPLHEPGQGNHGLRACDGYRYEFHLGKGASLADQVVYRVTFNKTAPRDGAPSASDPLGGGNELLYQLTGSQETYTVERIGAGADMTLGDDLPVAPNDHGPQTDRLVNGLGPFQGYDSGNPASRTSSLYDDDFAARFIATLRGGGRAFAGQRDDPFYLDEKGIFDLVNLCDAGLFNIAGARTTACEDVFAGFNVFTLALEVPISDLFPGGIPHNGVLDPDSTDSLLRIWFSVSRQEREIVDKNAVTGYRYEGRFRQVGRQALPLFNAGLVGAARQTLYLRTNPMKDVTRFGADILFPVLVRDAEALGIYAALGLDPDAAGLKGPRVDIIETINLGRPIPIEDGSTGDVITLDAAIDSQFPNGRSLQGGSTPNREQVDVSDVLISLIVAGNPAAGAGDGVNSNDKDYLTEFPFVAAPHSGLRGGHGKPAP